MLVSLMNESSESQLSVHPFAQCALEDKAGLLHGVKTRQYAPSEAEKPFLWRGFLVSQGSPQSCYFFDSRVSAMVVDLTATNGDARDDAICRPSSELNAISCQRKH